MCSSDLTDKLGAISRAINDHSLQFGSLSDDLNADLNNIKSAILSFDTTLQLLKQKLQSEIQQQEPEYYKESMRLFEQDMVFETTDYILNRRLKVDFDTSELLRNKIRNYGDWRLPGLIIRPGKENFIEYMVPLDPLYLVDTNIELLQPAISGFTQEYQRRLRPYVVDEYATTVFDQLPTNQFGFIFAYYFFNFKPVEIIEKFLRELYQKLRPGGVIIFTYNECKLSPGVGAVENNWMCYTPGNKIQSIIDSIGFETINNHVGTYDIAWFEIRKPGTITSIRGGQALAKIMPK